ncbi:MAG: 4'-phosphopantetheinyl transferase superfamily protein [Flavobacteriaceae bacterium]|nr:4'-phosphopantetheinyl transferase superfamily protein [Flavobacteriaceae bacterium]
MPLYKTLHPEPGTIIKLWKIEESYNELIKPLDLKDESAKRVEGMKSEIHRQGFLSIRHLLRLVGYTDQDLYYDEFGKPHLTDGKFISISHSYQYTGIIISDQPVGIDIEMKREKIRRIASKFIDYEKHYLDAEEDRYVDRLTTIWCIKESLYKLFAQPGLSFKTHTLVIPFELADGTTRSWIDYSGRKIPFDARFFDIDGFKCAFVTSS